MGGNILLFTERGEGEGQADQEHLLRLSSTVLPQLFFLYLYVVSCKGESAGGGCSGGRIIPTTVLTKEMSAKVLLQDTQLRQPDP